MANPFQNVAQMGVDQFWSLLQELSTRGQQVRDDLSADRLQLMALYTQARNDPDKTRGAAHMKALDPLVHNNSRLRLQYQDLAAKFKQAVNGASALLAKAGLSTPTLSGLGIAPGLIVLGVALAAAATAWGIYEALRVATSSQRQATATLASIFADPNLTPQQKIDAAKAYADAQKKAAPPGLDPLKGLMPIIVGVLAIVVAPTVLSMVKTRRSAA